MKIWVDKEQAGETLTGSRKRKRSKTKMEKEFDLTEEISVERDKKGCTHS